jgi:DNA-binding transcriptional regulator LsrR (DeoR family)
VPIGIGVAVGKDKVDPIVAGAAAGFFNQLVTDPATATAIMESL